MRPTNRRGLSSKLHAGGSGSGGPAVSSPAGADYSRTNANASDLLDLWNDPPPLQRVLGLVPVPVAEHAPRKVRLGTLRAGQDNAGKSLTRLRTVDPADLRHSGAAGLRQRTSLKDFYFPLHRKHAEFHLKTDRVR